MATENSDSGSNHSMRLEIVTPEQIVYSGPANYISAPGVQGELGILPHHSPLITLLEPGKLRIIQGDEEIFIAIDGGFLEVKPEGVIILADFARYAAEKKGDKPSQS